MEITSFILGVCAVIVITMVVGMLMIHMSLTQLKEKVNTLDREFDNQVEAIIRDNNALERKLVDYIDTLDSKSEGEFKKIYSYTDSRADKLESKFSNQIASGIEVKKALAEINDLNGRLDVFIRNYQNI